MHNDQTKRRRGNRNDNVSCWVHLNTCISTIVYINLHIPEQVSTTSVTSGVEPYLCQGRYIDIRMYRSRVTPPPNSSPTNLSMKKGGPILKPTTREHGGHGLGLAPYTNPQHIQYVHGNRPAIFVHTRKSAEARRPEGNGHFRVKEGNQNYRQIELTSRRSHVLQTLQLTCRASL